MIYPIVYMNDDRCESWWLVYTRSLDALELFQWDLIR
jgi:hypothetical protein